MTEARKKRWWNNTLIIITADHGSQLPGNSGPGNLEKYHIPMIWTGGALCHKPATISTVASQTDIAATILGQLGIDHSAFIFSRNILNSADNPFAFFTFNNGFGFYKNSDLLIYNTLTGTYYEKAIGRTQLPQDQGKAYLQSIYLDFIAKNK